MAMRLLQRSVLGLCTLGCLAAGTLWPIPGFGFGEPRVVPDTSFYFHNYSFDRYPDATVTRILSSHLIMVQIEGEHGMRVVQLAGIEPIPETAEPFYQQAIQAMEETILHRIVKLEGDDYQRNEEVTSFVQAYVWLEGHQMNATLVRSGLAKTIPAFDPAGGALPPITASANLYTPNIKYRNYYYGLQNRARAERLGIWSAQ